MQKSKIIGACGLTLLGLMAMNAKTVHADAITWNGGNANNNVLESNIKASDSVKANNSVITRKDIKTSHVNANAPIQKTKVAQFNNGSEIYSLDNSDTLSKSNGSGYVITNAGTYNGRSVDIGVTVNNVKDTPGSYTTKWSNGDKADVTGKLDNQFNYQNSVLVTSNSQAVNIGDVRNRGVQITRNRNVTKTTNSDFPYAFIIRSNSGSGGYHAYDDITDEVTDFIDKNENLRDAIEDAVRFNYDGYNADVFPILDSVSTLENKLNKADEWTGATDNRQNGGGKGPYADDLPFNHVRVLSITIHNGAGDEFSDVYGFRANPSKKYTISKKIVVPVTDHLLVDKVNKGSLNYNYTIGVYDAQTGELIDDLMPVYKGKVGSKATSSDSDMNNAIKNKILQINNHQAHSAFTGNQANDDVVFYLETQAVQDSKQLTANASRVITFNLPSSVNKVNYARLVGGSVNGNQVDITDNLRFTRTGITNLATNKTTYSNWNAVGNNDSFPSHTIVRIPGYTLTVNK